MALPQKVAKSPTAQVKTTTLQKNSGVGLPISNTVASPNVVSLPTIRQSSQGQAHQGVLAITDRVAELVVDSKASHQRLPQMDEPSAETVSAVSGAVNSTEDGRSHLSTSSTKPASFDTKSMASENTFAMDEKESLRPDDSASVQAADEDEPFFVPPVSGRPDPQTMPDGSNSGLGRTTHEGNVVVSHAARQFPITIMANPPRFGEITPSAPPRFPQITAPTSSFPQNQNGVDSLHQYPASSMPPDEKIIEAMGTPKDRLLLLQLEEKFLAFITQSKYVLYSDRLLSSH